MSSLKILTTIQRLTLSSNGYLNAVMLMTFGIVEDIMEMIK